MPQSLFYLIKDARMNFFKKRHELKSVTESHMIEK